MKQKLHILIVVLLANFQLLGQDLPSSSAEALDAYIKMREGYKHSSTKQFSRDEQFSLDDWCYAMDKKFPNTAETEYAWYLNNHYYTDGSDRIKKAYDLNPNHPKIIRSLFAHYMMEGDEANAKMLLSKISVSSNLQAYYSDLFPEKGVVIVSSEKDAIPLYYLQLKKGKGKNVKVVCMDFLISEQYRKAQMNSLTGGTEKFFGSEKAYLKRLMNNNSNVYLSSTVSQGYLDGNESNAFLVGLSYTSSPSSQIGSLQSFWNKIAQKDWTSLKLTSTQKKLYTNYLPPLLTLYKLKLARGNEDPVLKKGILALAEKLSQTKNVEMILNSYE